MSSATSTWSHTASSAPGTATSPCRPGVATLDPQKGVFQQGGAEDEIEALSRIIAELNERFGVELGPEHRVTIQQIIDRLEDDRALDAAARVNTRENVRLTFDHKVEEAIQEIVDSNFELYRRITDDRPFGELVKTLLFDQYLHGHRNAEELVKRGESKTLEFKSTLRWNLREDRKDNRVTHAVLKTIAAFLNTEGGDLLIGVADDGSVVANREGPASTTTTSSCFTSSRLSGTGSGTARARAWIPRPRFWTEGRSAWSAASAARSRSSCGGRGWRARRRGTSSCGAGRGR